jgi:rSAM/selenodomain-associated transferase 1
MSSASRFAIGVMARAPSAEGKTRLAPHLTPARLRALRAALFSDTLHTVSDFPDADAFVFVTPDDRVEEVAALAPAPIQCVRQGAGDLGQRMASAFALLIDERAYAVAVLVGTDSPFLTRDRIANARDALTSAGGVVLGPAEDGGFYLIGATKVPAALLRGIRWGTDSVLADTLVAAKLSGIETRLIASTFDIDTIDDLSRLERDLGSMPDGLAPNVRGWFRAGRAG